MSLDIVDNKDVNNWNVDKVTNKPTVLIEYAKNVRFYEFEWRD